MPHTLAGQTALITGGGRGIGRAVADELATHGATVVLAARSAAEVHVAAEDLRLRGAVAWDLVCDVANPEDVRALVERVVDECGSVDILINNAGILSPMGMTWEVDPEEWAYNIHVNLVGAFRVTHAVLPLMIEEGGGRIINVSTSAARSAIPGWSAYSAAKAGLDHFTRVLAAEVHPHGVRVNAVYPGATDTRMQAEIRGASDEQFPNAEGFRRRHAEGQLRDPREPAELIFWLCTSHARDLSGQILDIADPIVRERVAHDLGRPLLTDTSR